MPAVGLEPTLLTQLDFKSNMSTVPSHRQLKKKVKQTVIYKIIN